MPSDRPVITKYQPQTDVLAPIIHTILLVDTSELRHFHKFYVQEAVAGRVSGPAGPTATLQPPAQLLLPNPTNDEHLSAQAVKAAIQLSPAYCYKKPSSSQRCNQNTREQPLF